MLFTLRPYEILALLFLSLSLFMCYLEQTKQENTPKANSARERFLTQQRQRRILKSESYTTLDTRTIIR